MPATSQVLLPSTSHGSDPGVETLTGEKIKGAGFYGLVYGSHTVNIQVTHFTGTVTLQGSLASDPGDGDWIDIKFTEQGNIYSVDTTGLISQIGSLDSYIGLDATVNKIYNFTGNFVWIRAIVTDWTAGQINRVMLNF